MRTLVLAALLLAASTLVVSTPAAAGACTDVPTDPLDPDFSSEVRKFASVCAKGLSRCTNVAAPVDCVLDEL